MPADNILDQTPSVHHGNASEPYPCHKRAAPPNSQWGIDYGYCRTSLDVLSGSTDRRCPADCPHKAPAPVVVKFTKLFHWRGASAAAAWAMEARNG